jgi:hypothetical protein
LHPAEKGSVNKKTSGDYGGETVTEILKKNKRTNTKLN